MVSSMFDRINLVPSKSMVAKIKTFTPLVFVVLVVCIFLFFSIRTNQLKNKITKTRQQLSEMHASNDGYNTLKSIIDNKKLEAKKLTELSTQVEIDVKKLVNMQFDKKNFSTLIESIAKSQPGSVICKTINFSSGTCTIAGVAKGYNDLPAFVEALKQTNYFTQVTLGEVMRKSNDTQDIIFEFDIEAQLRHVK